MAATTSAPAESDDDRGSGPCQPLPLSTRGTRIAGSVGLSASTGSGTSGGGSRVRRNSPETSSSSRPSRRAYWTTKLLVKTPPGSLSSCPASNGFQESRRDLEFFGDLSQIEIALQAFAAQVSPNEVIQVVFRSLDP